MIHSFSLFILTLLLMMSAGANPAELLEIDVSSLRPTQSNVGMFEVERKAEKIRPLNKKDRHSFLKKEAIPVVVGPEGTLYLIDHHHLARAVMESGHNKAYAQIILNLSDLSTPDFWEEMKSRGYVYLKDAEGKAISVEQLPLEIKRLGDDPYRSLAGAVRRGGGYEKDKTPFAEFQWALFFRTRIFFDNTKESYEAAIERAVILAQSPEAEGLPGHRRMCQAIF